MVRLFILLFEEKPINRQRILVLEKYIKEKRNTNW